MLRGAQIVALAGVGQLALPRKLTVEENGVSGQRCPWFSCVQGE